jgi:hypothetical protein
VHTVTPATGRWRKEDHDFEANLGKLSETLSQKQNKKAVGGGMAQMVEYLPSIALSF